MDFPPPPEVGHDEKTTLADALEKQRPRFFRAAGGSARGKSGREDTERFADELMLLQECAQLVGERLGMSTIGYAMIYDREETSGYRFDESQVSSEPQIVGALANRRMPMAELLVSLGDLQSE